MAENLVQGTRSVVGLSGQPGRTPNQPSQRHAAGDSGPGSELGQPVVPHDEVSFRPIASVALRLLRERVLARTREVLQLDESIAVPVFAEYVEGEPVPQFLGRLLSAQNQLAGRRTGVWDAVHLRQELVKALKLGADETVELLTADGLHVDEAVAVVFLVLAEFERRIAAMLDA